MAEEQSSRELPTFDQPAGVPATFGEHARLMFDLQVLAYQSDLTRVITFMVGREFSSRTYPEVGAPGGHHPLSHERSADSQEQLTGSTFTMSRSLPITWSGCERRPTATARCWTT